MAPSDRCRIAPFGNPWIKGRLRLPADYRGLPRPSSPAAAKASVMRPNSLSAEISAEQPPLHHFIIFIHALARMETLTCLISPSCHPVAKEHGPIGA